jgi:glycosyltransferase involved in cell wall biosynthesis
MSVSVLHVYRTYYPDPPGGLQEAIRQIALTTKAFGIESSIFALSPTPDPVEIVRQEAKVIRGKSWAAPASCDLGGISTIRHFAELAKSVDIIHYHFPWPFADLMSLLVRPSTPALMTYHSDIVRQRLLGLAYAPLRQTMLASMKAVVATSPVYAKSSPVLSRPRVADKVRIIPLGIDESSYPAVGDNTIFEDLNLSPAQPYFLFIGVLRYYKGLHSLLSAAGSTRAKIVIAGVGPENDALQQMARQLGLHNVIFAGRISNPAKVALLANCRALVLPSHLRSEAFGMVLVEAAMFGKPMISCEINSGTSFVNKDKETGFVVSPETPDALAYAMNALADDPLLAETYGHAARSRYDALFSANALGQAYSSLYHEILLAR